MDYLTQEQVSTLATAYAPKSQHADEIRVASLLFDRALKGHLTFMSHARSEQAGGDTQRPQTTALVNSQLPESQGN